MLGLSPGAFPDFNIAAVDICGFVGLHLNCVGKREAINISVRVVEASRGASWRAPSPVINKYTGTTSTAFYFSIIGSRRIPVDLCGALQERSSFFLKRGEA